MREKVKIEYNTKGSLNFLYNTILGRAILKVITLPCISKICGIFMSTSISTLWINSFIKNNNISINEYENKKYTSFNDFFTRKILPNKRNIDRKETAFIAPCDAKLTAYNITEDASFCIKGTNYTLSELLQDELLAKQYIAGTILIFRLAVDDYHRYCFIDNGIKEQEIKIKGILHTVQPIAFNRYNVYKTNSREYTILHTENFGDVIHMEVGALMVGKINNHININKFFKGDEKGFFEFGGSTICLIIKKDILTLDEEIFENTKNGFETIVKLGERIGVANEKVFKN